MKTSLSLLASFAVLFLTGCATNTHLFGTLQSADETLAAKYGVPASAVGQLRTFLGIPDARTLPAADRVLPQPYVWFYDVLDAEGHIVDVSGYHYGTVPRVRQGGTNGIGSVFGPLAPAQPASTGTATLEGLLQLIQANPALLAPAK